MERIGFNSQYLITIVIGLVLLAIVWNIVKGVIRLALTLGIIAVVAYFVLNALR